MESFLVIYDRPATKATLERLSVHARHILQPEAAFAGGYYLWVNDEDVAEIVKDLVSEQGCRVRIAPSRIGKQVIVWCRDTPDGIVFRFVQGREHVQAEAGREFVVPVQATVPQHVAEDLSFPATIGIIVQGLGAAMAPGLVWRVSDAETGKLLWQSGS